jgi:2-oxoglutarate ferredoxin oxidoreductase subunit beta
VKRFSSAHLNGCNAVASRLAGDLTRRATDELAAYKLAQLPIPGVFYQSDRPTKNALEKNWIDNPREKVGNASDLELLQKTFDRMK